MKRFVVAICVLASLALANDQSRGRRRIRISACTANCTVAGTLSLTATIESIGFRQAFTGDGDADNSAVVEFRTSDVGGGAGSWKTAYTPYTDRRATIGGDANPYVNQFRGSIVGLTADTSYDVRTTITDPDGGSAIVNATTSTVDTTPTFGGTLRTVSNDGQLATAMGLAVPGDTIHLNAGTYAAFTWSVNGTSGAWINIEGEGAGTSIIDGAGIVIPGGNGTTTAQVILSANYVVLQHLTLTNTDFTGVSVGDGKHHVFVQDNTMSNISRLCTDDATTGGIGSHYYDAGVNIGNTDDHVYALRNSITSTSLASCTHTDNSFDTPATGVQTANCSVCVISSNTITGAFRDGAASDNSTLALNDSDMSANTLSGYIDDGIEAKGENINVRLWGNIISNTAGNTCLAANTNTTNNLYGPLYFFRNACRVTTTKSGFIYKIGDVIGGIVPMYAFHNSADATPGGKTDEDGFTMGNGAGATPVFFVALNNIVKSLGDVIAYAAPTVAFDYDLLYSTSGNYVYRWDLLGIDHTYANLADFKAGTGQETHGLGTDPQFSDTGLHLCIANGNPVGCTAASPALNVGTPINNFNTSDSAWPSTGAPDMGAYER